MSYRNDKIRGVGLATVLASLLLCLSATCSFAQQDREQIDIPILRSQSFRVPENLTVCVRLKNIAPEEPTPIQWRHGGEGQGGEVVRGVFPKVGVPADCASRSPHANGGPVVRTCIPCLHGQAILREVLSHNHGW
ncbi:MAG: hypothetical protein H8E73_02685 [Planctomycetes bacterium]|nr:hypothetical protein [Planctomycetota bacterium]